MMLSEELNRLEEMTRMLHMTLCGLRVPGALVGAMEYVRDEAESINTIAGWLAGRIKDGAMPDADAGPIQAGDGRA
jgi:hypothetical protein